MNKKIAVIIVCIIFISIVTVAFLTGVKADNSYISGNMMLEQALKQKQRLVVADFYVNWCGYCRRFAPILHDLKDEYKDKYIFVFVNCEDPKNEKYVKDFYIPAYPSLYLINPTNNNRVLASQDAYGDSNSLRIEFNKFLSENNIK
ncbi:MAG: thioredoxin domain-containing protein [Candidatus Gastranaerophilaceae bacterium]|jgi:thiol-disulfide isomerase/thioredoxin